MAAPVAQPRASSRWATVRFEASSGSRSCTARCCPGSLEVRIEATEGFVHEACAIAVSKTTASRAKASSSGVVLRG